MENNKDKKTDDILEKLVHINRITKVVKGGRRFGFSALVVVGNQAGKIGIAHAKAKQVPDAIKKANEMARRKLTHIPLREGRTIHHDVKAKDGSGRIVLRAASLSIELLNSLTIGSFTCNLIILAIILYVYTVYYKFSKSKINIIKFMLTCSLLIVKIFCNLTFHQKQWHL